MPDLMPNDDLVIVENGIFLNVDGEEDRDGRIVAVVRVAGVRPFLQTDVKPACANYFEEGWLAWELADVRPASSSRMVRAARGIYELELPDDMSIGGVVASNSR